MDVLLWIIGGIIALIVLGQALKGIGYIRFRLGFDSEPDGGGDLNWHRQRMKWCGDWASQYGYVNYIIENSEKWSDPKLRAHKLLMATDLAQELGYSASSEDRKRARNLFNRAIEAYDENNHRTT